MKYIIFLCCVLWLPSHSIAQGNIYQPIEQSGWEMANFSPPETLTPLDTGSVKYLVTINSHGKVKHVKMLFNSFDPLTEKKWRRKVKKLEFVRIDATPLPRRKHSTGTIAIRREPCADPTDK